MANPTVRACATQEVHERLLRTSEGYATARANIEEQAWRAALRPGTTGRSGCTEIPVVVHVVHRTNAEDISMAQIESQIEVLNEDFRAQNADTSTVPGAFSGLVADARVQFALATTDPDGNPTDGVVRVRTNVNGFSPDDDMKRAADGGSDAWPADRYLNIWVCRLAGGLLGYAQFPGGPAATDGVVIRDTAFGNTGTAAAPFDQGRTATHEIGHWLNLRHIWGDDGNGCSGDDFVADTPNQAGANVGVPTFPSVSCSNGPNGDLFVNYMDYVDDAVMVMFTQGQVDRMQAALDGPRSAIGSSVACTTGGGGPKILWKDGPKDPIKDAIKERPKDFIKEPIKERPKDLIKEPVKELPKDPPKEFPKDPPKDFGKDGPKDPPKEFPKDPPKDMKEGPKDFPKDPPKDIKEGPKDFPKDGPKDFKEGPKDGVFDPVGPIDPIGPVKLDPPFEQPFVIATGAGVGQRRSASADALRAQMWALYNALASYGMGASYAAGVQQAEALYRQENG